MTDKELRRLKRVDLLELLIAQTRENDRLKEELAEVRAQLAERDLVLNEAGSIAEAALRINGVYQATQAAVDQYIRSIQQLGAKQRQSWEDMERKARARADEYLREATEKCRRMEAEAVRRRDAILAQPPRQGAPAPQPVTPVPAPPPAAEPVPVPEETPTPEKKPKAAPKKTAGKAPAPEKKPKPAAKKTPKTAGQ